MCKTLTHNVDMSKMLTHVLYPRVMSWQQMIYLQIYGMWVTYVCNVNKCNTDVCNVDRCKAEMCVMWIDVTLICAMCIVDRCNAQMYVMYENVTQMCAMWIDVRQRCVQR